MNQSSPGRTLQKSKNVGLLIVEAKLCETPSWPHEQEKPSCSSIRNYSYLRGTASRIKKHVRESFQDFSEV